MLIYVISIFKKIAVKNSNFMVVNVGMTKWLQYIDIIIPELFILFLFFAVYRISCNEK